MPSFKSYLYRYFIKRYFARKKVVDINAERQELNALGARLPLAQEVTSRPVNAGGTGGEWLQPANAISDAAILYLHGGVYLIGSCDSHRSMASFIARSCRMPVLLINYRLAPEHPYPAGLDDAEQAFDWLIAEHRLPAQRIILMGDSAGGGMALALALRLKRRGPGAQAGAVVAMSPWTDLTLSGESVTTRLARDPCFCKLLPLASGYVAMYAADHPLTNEEISPLFGDPAGLPPLLLQVGEDEILYNDAHDFARNARNAGVEVTFSPWRGMWHVWQCLVPGMKESRQAIEEIGRFCREVMGNDT
ncbi:alpha/beta hydrolase [Enterobacillus tribolii]|uniref:Acetyl esterase/lipase n=1 Tax=Enterobacillus tribolii TaxID=1487935 RepID=A0A370R4W7_9GAMM|nr:alpha/beta hydrolase [Enterobacillus tribolii]MBW7983404.1 alpha/beta hydrolase [Enterobacillus tribolii]RDK97464.1 acetyl esterase/lipase [Enterobacillus tribolii]